MADRDDLWWDCDREAIDARDGQFIREIGLHIIRWAQESGLTLPQAIGYVEVAKCTLSTMFYRQGTDDGEPDEDVPSF